LAATPEFEDNSERFALLLLTPAPKPKGLPRVGRKARSGHADKNALALRGMINLGVEMSSDFGRASFSRT
jgi:hypothetical protein